MQAKYPEGKLLKRCLKQLAFNHFVLNPLGLPAVYLLAKTAGVRMTSPLPSWREAVFHVVICIIVEDALFYWTHRLLHIPPLYRRFHKLHHQFYTPIGMAAEYAHPVEYVLSNSLPVLAGPLLTGCHLLTMWIWLFIRTVETLDGHSGYDFWWMPFRYFPFRPGPAIHDFHHSHNLGNYGSFFQFWDWICGTDKAYKKYVEQIKSASEKKS
jgi:sterol desaturase/sphingolipid hydroxylase (fatty acid hydroxylase superfamily)